MRLVLLILLCFLFGCANKSLISSSHKDDFREIDKIAKNNKVKVTLLDGQTFLGDKLKVNPDSTFLLLLDDENDRRLFPIKVLATKEIHKITINKTAPKISTVLLSTGIGLVVGAVIGGASQENTKSENTYEQFGDSLANVFVAALALEFFGTVGAIVGSLKAVHDNLDHTYILNEKQ